MKQKINLRLSLIALFAVVATTLGLTLVFYNLFQSQVRDDLRINAQLLADSELFQQIYDKLDEETDSSDFEALTRLKTDNLRITWVSPDGTVLYDNDTDAAELENHLDRPEIQEALASGSGESVRRSDTFNLNTFYYALRLDNGTVLRVSTQARSIASMFFTIMPVIVLVCIVIAALCILLGHFLTKQLLRPIDQMAEHLDDRIVTPVYKELEPFADKIRSQHENILSAATMRQDFTANISHELKTPLTAITGYAELIENRMVSAEKAPHYAEQIRKNSDRLLSLINDIIRLSELDHNELPRNFVPVDLYALAQDCCRNLQVSADQRGVALTCTGDPVTLSADRDLMKELLDNLVQNAIRYNREDGWVRVTVASESGHPTLSVRDNGIGIAKDQQERIFERFYRVDKSRSRESGGTGLGLAIVKHIAEIHNAVISVDSAPNMGTEIRVSF